MVQAFVEMFEMEIVRQMGRSGTRSVTRLMLILSFESSCKVVTKDSSNHSSDQKLRDFRPRYLTKNIIIREYSNLGKIWQFLLNHFDSENELVISCPDSSTHVWWCSSLSSGAWNRAIFGRYYGRCAIFGFVFYAPKRRFWKTKQWVGRVFLRHFASGIRPNRVLTLAKRLEKTRPTRCFPKSSFGMNIFHGHRSDSLLWPMISSDQKLRDFRHRYLTKNIIISEYLNLGKISQFLLNHFDRDNELVIACPNSSTHVWWCSSLSSGAWNRAIFGRFYVHGQKITGCISHIDRPYATHPLF